MAARNYCFTVNNWTEEDQIYLRDIKAPVRGITWGREVGESGTPHLQGYVEFFRPMRITGIKKLGGPFATMWLGARRGSREQAIEYARKGDDWEEAGDLAVTQGYRSDLDHVRRDAADGGMREVTLYANMQQIAVAKAFLTYHEEPRDWETDVHWYWGETRAGKSRAAREATAKYDTFTKNDGSRWWDGYDGHEAVIIDDFRDSWWSLTEMLSLLDRYEKRVEVKGGWRQFKPRMIVVTSIHPPEHMYRIADEDAGQLRRRINVVTKFRCNEVGEGNTVPLPLPVRADNITDIEEVLADLLSG